MAAAGNPYLEPVSRLPQGTAAGKNQVAAIHTQLYGPGLKTEFKIFWFHLLLQSDEGIFYLSGVDVIL